MDKHWKWPVIAFMAGVGVTVGALAVQEMTHKPPWLVPALFGVAITLFVVAIVWAASEPLARCARWLREFRLQPPMTRRPLLVATPLRDERREKLTQSLTEIEAGGSRMPKSAKRKWRCSVIRS